MNELALRVTKLAGGVFATGGELLGDRAGMPEAVTF